MALFKRSSKNRPRKVVSSLKLLKPIAVVAIAQTEGDESTWSAQLLKAEETAVVKSIKMCEDFSLKPTHTAVYMLDPSMLARASSLEISKTDGVITAGACHCGLDKGFGKEMEHGSRDNISHQPPGGKDCVDLRHFPLLPPSSSRSQQHHSSLSASGPCFGTLTLRLATG